jgi:glutamate-1-semialdehyde 2,1-aminomutase
MSIHDELFARARRVAPGGVNSPVRAFRSVGGVPRFIRRGEGAHLYGEGDERWVDFCMAWGPNILGHAHPVVVEAVRRAAVDGLAFGTVTRGEVELAERILAAFPGRDRVRLVCSGTEAVMTALRVARAATGRPRILKFAGCYHGHADSMLVRGGSGLVTFGQGDSAGVCPSVSADTLVAPLDSEEAVDAAFAAHGDEIAAVIVEAVPANNGLLVQRDAWLRHVRDRCTAHGALLIFDEVITGFRFGFHGYERVCGVTPDLTTLGKIVGGGLPLAAVVGPASHMDMLAPAGPAYQAGTMAGNPIAVAAGSATLDVLPSVYGWLDALGRHFDGLPGRDRWVRHGPIVWPWLADGDPPRADGQIPGTVRPVFARMHARWLEAGVYFPPSAFEVGFLSAAHTLEDLDLLVTVANAA